MTIPPKKTSETTAEEAELRRKSNLLLKRAIQDLQNKNSAYKDEREKHNEKPGIMFGYHRMTADTEAIMQTVNDREESLQYFKRRLDKALSDLDQDEIIKIEREFKQMIRVDLLADEVAHGQFSISSSSRLGEMLNKGRVTKMLNEALESINKLEKGSVFKNDLLDERAQQDQAILLHICNLLLKMPGKESEAEEPILQAMGEIQATTTIEDMHDIKENWFRTKATLLEMTKHDPNALQAVEKALSKLFAPEVPRAPRSSRS